MPKTIRQSDIASPTQQNSAIVFGGWMSARAAAMEWIEATEIIVIGISPSALEYIGPARSRPKTFRSDCRVSLIKSQYCVRRISRDWPKSVRRERRSQAAISAGRSWAGRLPVPAPPSRNRIRASRVAAAHRGAHRPSSAAYRRAARPLFGRKPTAKRRQGTAEPTSSLARSTSLQG